MTTLVILYTRNGFEIVPS